MRILFALLGAFLFTFPALAQDWHPDIRGHRIAGEQVVLSATTTHDVATWSFSSRGVEVCLPAGLAEGQTVFMRIGTTASATSSANFVTGGGNMGADDAVPLTGSGDGSDQFCRIYPLNVKGLYFHLSPSLAAATVDVLAID